jgi:hypothetical protein
MGVLIIFLLESQYKFIEAYLTFHSEKLYIQNAVDGE